MKNSAIAAIVIVVALVIVFGIYYYSTNKSSPDLTPCANEGENVYDMDSKGPTSCCSGLIFKPCEGTCTPSIPGKCITAGLTVLNETQCNKACLEKGDDYSGDCAHDALNLTAERVGSCSTCSGCGCYCLLPNPTQ